MCRRGRRTDSASGAVAATGFTQVTSRMTAPVYIQK